MMGRIRRFFSRFGFVFFFALLLYFVIMVILALVWLTVQIFILTGSGPLEAWLEPTNIMILVYCVCLAIGITTVVASNKVLFRPIRQMVKAMERLAAGDFTTRVELKKSVMQPREIGDFAKSFNLAAEELGSTEILRRDFINDFSHEFKTPIVSLGGFARLLQEGGGTPEEREEYLQIIIAEADRLAALATNVLDMSRVEAQTILAQRESFDLTEQVRRAILTVDGKWMKKGLELDIELAELRYKGAPDLLQQVWVNLLDNAMKFSKPGGRVAIRLKEKEGGVAFTVRDKGPGMRAEERARIFEKFYQSDRSRHTEGNGLGLSMVGKIVALHEGRVDVTTSPGVGSIFTVWLPVEGQGAEKE